MKSIGNRRENHEDHLVHLYQNITQCGENRAKSVFILLSDVRTESDRNHFGEIQSSPPMPSAPR